MVPVIKNFWERFTVKNYGLVSLVSVVSKIVVKFVNNKIVDHLQKCVSFGLFLLFSVIESFEWFLMGSLHKNIHLMLEFCKAPLLVQHFSKYTLMTFLMVLSIILLSMLMIILSTLKSGQTSDLWHCIQEN